MSVDRRNGPGELDLAAMPQAWVRQIAECTATILEERWRKAASIHYDERQQTEYLTIDEAAEVLRAKRQRVYDLRSMGRLTAYGDGARGLVKRSELEAYIAAGDARRVADPLPPERKTA